MSVREPEREWERNTHETGPLVWIGIIATTCLALFIFQKVLWLVMPFLFALVLYYLLAPPMRWLVLRGWTPDAATAMVMGVFVGLFAIALIFGLPWLAGHMLDWQDLVSRYGKGGLRLIDHSLRVLEEHWSLLREADVAAKVSEQTHYWFKNFAVEQTQSVIMDIGSWLPTLLLVPFITFFQLRDGRRFKDFISDAVPNAFFEKTLFLLNEIDHTTRAYFHGLIKLTVLDTLTLAGGLWWMGMPAPIALGLVCAIFAWIPYVGSIAGGLLVIMVAATDFPDQPGMAWAAVALFLAARLLDDFVYMPQTVGRSLHMHPLLTVLMIFIGGAIAGITGLMFVLPLLGVIMVIGGTLGEIVTDPRLMARHRQARALRKVQASADLY
ncbi:MAG TPA: AI-2E family transporter [Rhodocyclaceae bacterium]|nr:AI-2E family transporter [Rhodocyclaceae bacterium]